MCRLRGLFFSLGLAAMTGLMASEARAETLTLSVFAGSGTSGTLIYTNTGSAIGVGADTGTLNGDLARAGFGAYSFSNLGGSSNNPGSTNPLVSSFIQTVGGMSVIAGGSGAGTPITVVVSEGGFRGPPNGPELKDVGQGNFVGLSSGSLGTEGVFTDATGASKSTGMGTLTSTGFTTVSTPLGAYVTPFSLENQTVLSGTSRDTGAIGLVQTVTVEAILEPASIVMMLTGMTLPLVVVVGGLLRRRAAA